MTTYQQFLQQAAAAYKFDPTTLKLVNKYEDGGRSSFDVNNWDSNAKAGTPSGGPFQFVEGTFNSYAPQARAANPGAWQGVPMSWKDPRAQALAASWAMANGHGSAWTTYSRAQKEAGKTAAAPATAAAPIAPAPASSDDFAARMGLIFNDDPAFVSLLTARHARMAPAATPTPAAAPVTSTSGGASSKAPPQRPGEKGYEYLQRLGSGLFGLRNDPGNSQLNGGQHTAGSEHYADGGRAIDFGDARNSPDQLRKWMAWAKAHGFDTLWEGNHVHVSLPGGGV